MRRAARARQKKLSSIHFAVKLSTLDSHGMPSSFNHSEWKTLYRLASLSLFLGGVCANAPQHYFLH